MTATTSQPARPPTNDGLTIRGFVLGIASGTTKMVVGHPFDTIKVRLQTEGGHGRFLGPMDCVRATLRREGVRGFYRGATPPLIGWAVMDSVQLGTLTNLRNLLKDDKGTPLTVPQHALAGLGAGLTVSFVAAPVELLKAKLQVQYGDASTTKFRGPLDCARAVARTHRLGVLGLWQQLPATILFRSFFWLLWGSYEVYTQGLRRAGVADAWVPFLAGGLAANTFWAASFPADVIKNRMMAQPLAPPPPPGTSNPYASIASTARHIWRTEGARGFFRGFVMCQLRSFPTNGAALIVFEFLNKELHWL
ncbi:hypothetical protein H9P43_003297 [Blastocladiella emersonii ATCC 22665]|nr:hypothetical protein H9P43_003297 [Blastocladiella emersonii ATCC 22665]